MSAVFLVRYRTNFVKFSDQAGKRIFQLVDRADATPFTSEGDAWLAAYQHNLRPDHTEVRADNPGQEAA